MGSHKVAGKSYVFTKTSQMASIGVIFTSTYHTKQLNPWPNSASRVVNYSQLSACQGDMQPFEGDPYTRGRLISLRNKPQQKQPGQLSASIPITLNIITFHSPCTDWLRGLICVSRHHHWSFNKLLGCLVYQLT